MFDLCIIGCGPGGFAGAMRAVDLGKKVCLVEGDEIGGAAVKWGALASKTMWELSKDFQVASQTDRGFSCQNLSMDYPSLRSSVLDAVAEKQRQMRLQLQYFAPDRFSGPGSIDYKQGWAKFISADEITLSGDGIPTETISAKNFLIATGSKPRTFPFVTPDECQVLTSDGILNLEHFPKHLLIIGAGIVGCEYATIFSNYGQTRVTLIDHLDRVLPFEDEDISRFVSRNLRGAGVDIRHHAKLKSLDRSKDGVRTVFDRPVGKTETITVDAVLISIGRVPNLQRLDLARAGVTYSGQGHLEVDDGCRLAPHIYATGDVTPHPALVNVAERESRHAVEAMFQMERRSMPHYNMSTVMFFQPPVAAVGLNESACRARKIPYRVATYANALLPRALAMHATDGFVKILVSNDDQQQILGMRAAGPQASATIMSIAYLLDHGSALTDVIKTLPPHPTLSEGIQECLRALQGMSIYKAVVFPDWISIRCWDPGRGEYQP